MKASRPRLLLVEDDPTFRMLLSRELTQRGFRVFPTEGVTQAVDVLGAQDVDVALVDLRLLDGTGIDVLRAAKEQRPRSRCVC